LEEEIITENHISFAINYDAASAERMNGEYMLINFDTGKYFSVADFGSDIITLIYEKVDRNSWETILRNSWNVDPAIRLEVLIDEFLGLLIQHNLIYKIDIFNSTDCKLPEDLDRKNFSFPPLKIYEDMSDLLMVDPIHDTTLKGWPNVEKND
jgi:hypothetical protein